MRRALALGVSTLLVGGGVAKAENKVPKLTPRRDEKGGTNLL